MATDPSSRRIMGSHPSRQEPNPMAQLVYELSFKGAASDALAGAFENCTVTSRSGTTVVRSEVPDQAALHGLLARVHALGLEILELRLVAEPGVDDSLSLDT